MSLSVGNPAPDFTLPDQSGVQHALHEYAGKWLVLYFYPKDDTPGCTKEACGFRDTADRYAKEGIAVVGISKDSVKSHQKFIQKHHLPFTLLSDAHAEVISLYGASKALGTRRMTYLINPDGLIAQVYSAVSPETHSEEILRDIQQLRS